MAIIGLYLSYGLPIIYMLIYGRSSLHSGGFGPFRLPSGVGVVTNVVSLLWIAIAIFFSTFPLTIPVTAQNMNYSTVVMAGWVLFGMVYYLGQGRHKFEVPALDNTSG